MKRQPDFIIEQWYWTPFPENILYSMWLTQEPANNPNKNNTIHTQAIWKVYLKPN